MNTQASKNSGALGFLRGGLLLAALWGTAHAANLTVNSLADTTTAADGFCTLREAINNANSDIDTTGGDCTAGSGADTIGFSAGGTITLGSTLPVIVSDITIDGTGQSVTVSGNNAVRVLAVSGGAALTVQHLTVANGQGTGLLGGGIGIASGGALTVSHSTFSGNTTSGPSSGSGGGISNFGSLTVTDSTFSGNTASNAGGGIFNLGSITVTDSTFSGNAGNAGGGIYINGGTLTVSNSTFSGNAANIGGGGISNNFGNLTVSNSTFSGNAGNAGGGIFNNSHGTLNLANTLLANSTGGDCANRGTLNTSSGVNLVEDGSCNANLSGDPNLGPLASNGGPTQTHALLAGSIAIDAADDAICAAPPVNGFDQRGVIRPQGAHCDIGSFEVAVADLSVIKTDDPDPVLVSDHLTWTVTVANSGTSAATGVMLTDSLPASGFTFVSTTPSQGNCGAPAGGVIACNLGNLANGAHATVTIVVTPTAVGTLSNSVEVMGNEFDEHLANNTATQTTTVSPLLCNGLVPTIVGTPGDDLNLRGTDRPDVIQGLGGNDIINGGDGRDVICGGEGKDTLRGGDGDDTLLGENGNDTLFGGDGKDALNGDAGTDVCNGGDGKDTGINCETMTGIP
jgi:uncharacterized repeat protein (TIGR01451 family)/CSLREA domain-containing protein